MIEGFSAVLWRNIRPQYQQLIRTPFIRQITAGDLPRQQFLAFLEQDDFFLKQQSLQQSERSS